MVASGVSACGSSSGSSSSGAGQAKTVNPNGPEVSPAGDIPDNQAYVAYSPPGSGFSVKVPEGWARTTPAKGVTSFTDKLNRVRMEQRSATSALTLAGARHSVIPALARSVPGFKVGTVSTVSRGAGSAIRITYQAASPVDPVTGRSHTDSVERYVFFHHGRRVVLTLSGPKGADNVDPWKIVTDSLRYTR
ncbi:hypothetical protein NBH00_08690 [Paraconexibacter antarcticus]|uniref:Lipoprotein n=1 Tax=Paraconexibacter antarcticus TaxID=2949664 RepID=A0ABY5DY52_9ACTN|nr:hypothetical protein [Paraconexibacter antarcticus]UTI66268.1 hypothetical protein NBH00_08690 [Paraconexibacter antarcticus]